jgi:hypothetical protein
MQRTLILVFALIASFSSLTGRQVQIKHAPTVDQCQADQRLWLSKLGTAPDTDLPNFSTLTEWESEMNDCQTVDPVNQAKYYNTQEEASEVQSRRLLRFIGRHGLYEQFVTEDAIGKR